MASELRVSNNSGDAVWLLWDGGTATNNHKIHIEDGAFFQGEVSGDVSLFAESAPTVEKVVKNGLEFDDGRKFQAVVSEVSGSVAVTTVRQLSFDDRATALIAWILGLMLYRLIHHGLQL